MKRTRVIPTPVDDPTLQDPKAYEEHSIRELRSSGFRITMPRVQVIRALADSKTALSAYAIHEKIVLGGGKIDVVSVYRILATLTEVGLIHKIGVADGYYPNRMSEGAKQTEVMVDGESMEVLELQIPQEIVKAIDAQAKEHGFEVGQIKVEIIGAAKASGKSK